MMEFVGISFTLSNIVFAVFVGIAFVYAIRHDKRKQQ